MFIYHSRPNRVSKPNKHVLLAGSACTPAPLCGTPNCQGDTPKWYFKHSDPFNDRTSSKICLVECPKLTRSCRAAAISMPQVCSTAWRHCFTISLPARGFAPFDSIMVLQSSDMIFIVSKSTSDITSQQPVFFLVDCGEKWGSIVVKTYLYRPDVVSYVHQCYPQAWDRIFWAIKWQSKRR